MFKAQMYKIALTGKANTGKNTTAILLKNNIPNTSCKLLAFADPIKEMLQIMFPQLTRNQLYGSSKLRSTCIEGALDSEGKPLTIRQGLIDIGTKLGRGYRDSIWLDNFEYRLQKQIKKNIGMVIVTDVRFRNEFDYLKSKGFYMIRLNRETETKINHVSETNQDSIQNSEFDFVINNNFGIDELTSTIINKIVPNIKICQ